MNLNIMVIWVVKFPKDGYKIRQTFGRNSKTKEKYSMYFENRHSTEPSKIVKETIQNGSSKTKNETKK